MASYDGTNDYAGLVETNPTGAEDAAKIDDAIRETRKVAKAVNALIHTSLGALRVAVWRDKPTLLSGGGYGGGPINTWNSKTTWSRLIDSTSLDQESGTQQSFQPIAGTYLIYAWCPGYGIDRHQIRLFNITNNGLEGSLMGSQEISRATDNTQTSSTLIGTFTTDGTKHYKIQHIQQTLNNTNGWGIDVAAGTSAQNYYGGIMLLKIG